jgi:hypothetical protein
MEGQCEGGVLRLGSEEMRSLSVDAMQDSLLPLLRALTLILEALHMHYLGDCFFTRGRLVVHDQVYS